MTVSTDENTVTAVGDGATVAFSFPYLVYQSSHLTITLDGVTTTSWTAATYGAAAGVTVTFNTAPDTDVAIVIQRIVPNTQETDLEDFDGNPADVTEKQFDLLVMADQQIDEKTERSILAPIGTTLTTNVITGTIDTTTRALTITTAGPASSDLSIFPTTVDITTTSLASGDYLKYDGAAWINETAAETLTALASGTSAGSIAVTDSMLFLDADDSDTVKQELVSDILKLIYPVGSLYVNKTVSTNPATLFGFGTWVAIEDAMIIGASATYAAESTGGSATTTVAEANLPSSLGITVSRGNSGDGDGSGDSFRMSSNDNLGTSTATLSSVGSGTALDTISPYIAAYIWERTA